MTWSLFLWEGWDRVPAALPTQSGLWEGGRERSSAPGVWSAHPLSPLLVLPWGWLCLLSPAAPARPLGCHLLLSVPFWLAVDGAWLLGSNELLPHREQVIKSCSAASSRAGEDPGQQQEHPGRTQCISGCSASLSRGSAEGDA